MPTWNYSATAASLLKDLHDSSHRSMRTSNSTKNCTKDRRVACAWGGSLSTTDVINPRGFCVEIRPISLEVPFSRCSQMQLSSAPQAAGTAVTTESSHKKQQPSQRKFKGQGTQRHLHSLLLYPLSSRFLLSLYERQGKRARVYHVMAKWMEEIKLPLSSLPILGEASMFSLGSVGSKIASLSEGLI